MASTEKKWGQREFWGVGSHYDPQWVLTDAQKKLQEDLIELCRVKLRPSAIKSDKTYEYPRDNLDALAEMGLLGLMVPKEMGGRGENHVCASMVVETIARYGCPSTAMVYVMHLAATATILFRYHDNPTLQNLLKRLDKEKLVGTLSYSDPATGSHFWFPLSSKCRTLPDECIKILKLGSWVTSAGFSDWYAIQTVSPRESKGDYSDLSVFLILKDEVRASTDEWKALGMRGNQSAPLIVETIMTKDRLVGQMGEGANSNDEIVDPFFLLMSSACWNGLAFSMMDIAKKHVTRKAHADVGMRVCDYPTIQDYFGDSVSNTNNCRVMNFGLAQGMDGVTNNNDFSLHKDLDFLPRKAFLHWLWQMKYEAAKNVDQVADTMLHACGGTGYKEGLGLERIYRDAKAGWVMAISNEYIRQLVGKTALMGMDAIDYWEQKVNKPMVQHELTKMTLEEKKKLAEDILKEVDMCDQQSAQHGCEFQDTDFENPFNTQPPTYNKEITATDGTKHKAALDPKKYVKLPFVSKEDISHRLASFTFGLPNSDDYIGCLPGQYVKVRVHPHGKPAQERYLSPTSNPLNFGQLELVLLFESTGLLSQHFQHLKPGNPIEVMGPCGGFEYKANALEQMTILASGAGVTPGLQLIRCNMADPKDKTKILLMYYTENDEEILHKEEFDGYAAKDGCLRVVYSVGESPPYWNGEEGFMDQEMLERHMIKPNGMKHKIVICGGPTMVVACLYALRNMGYPSEDIFVYGQFGVSQVKMVYGRNTKLSSHTCD